MPPPRLRQAKVEVKVEGLRPEQWAFAALGKFKLRPRSRLRNTMMQVCFMQFSYLWLMRLTKKEIEAIKETAANVFGESVEVRIFGSRTDDNKKGGDIDLLISGVKDDDLNVGAKIKFLVLLKQIIGDQKIDVLLDRPSLKSRSLFYKSVEQSSVRL